MIGIYGIRNKINNKIYIGQSWNIEARWRAHKNTEHNRHLRSAYEKYGVDNFELVILREFQESSLTDIFLTLFEQKFMDEYDSRNPEKGYNFRGAGNKGKLAEESKQRISAANKGRIQPPEEIEKRANTIRGKKRSNISKQRYSEAKKRLYRGPEGARLRSCVAQAQKGKAKAEEHKQKIRKAIEIVMRDPERRKLQSENLKKYYKEHPEEKIRRAENARRHKKAAQTNYV